MGTSFGKRKRFYYWFSEILNSLKLIPFKKSNLKVISRRTLDSIELIKSLPISIYLYVEVASFIWSWDQTWQVAKLEEVETL